MREREGVREGGGFWGEDAADDLTLPFSDRTIFVIWDDDILRSAALSSFFLMPAWGEANGPD